MRPAAFSTAPPRQAAFVTVPVPGDGVVDTAKGTFPLVCTLPRLSVALTVQDQLPTVMFCSVMHQSPLLPAVAANELFRPFGAVSVKLTDRMPLSSVTFAMNVCVVPIVAPAAGLVELMDGSVVSLMGLVRVVGCGWLRSAEGTTVGSGIE